MSQTDDKKTLLKKRIISGICIAVMLAGIYFYTVVCAHFDGDAPVRINISKHDTPESARDSIVNALGESLGSTVFRIWNRDIDATHGSYLIEPGEKAWQIGRKLSSRQQSPIMLTFNNVRTFNQLAERLAAKMDFSAEEFLEAANARMAAEKLNRADFEAEFLPDSYEVYWSADPNQVITKIRKNYFDFWTDARQEQARKMHLTPLQVSILASIVEEESNKRDERPKIARLYLNRLNRGMLLQADPTVKFAMNDPSIKRITGPMLSTDSPYNTYRYPGLPPGIIRLPEAATLNAVLNAPQHNYIYMCARPDGSGYHDFTADYKTHVSNASNYRKTVYKK